MRVRILAVPNFRAHPRLPNLLKWPSTIQQKQQYNLRTRRRYFFPWILAYLNSKEHRFFLFYHSHKSMSGCKRTCFTGNYAPSSTNTACWTPRETTEERRPSQGIRTFFTWCYHIFLFSFAFFVWWICHLINILNLQAVEESDRKTRAQIAQEQSLPGKQFSRRVHQVKIRFISYIICR